MTDCNASAFTIYLIDAQLISLSALTRIDDAPQPSLEAHLIACDATMHSIELAANLVDITRQLASVYNIFADCSV